MLWTMLELGENLSENLYHKLFIELSAIGSGYFGTVFKVKHRFDEQIYAVKRVEIKKSTDEYMTQILNEVKNLGKVRSEYVVQYYNSWPESKHLYIQMEFCSHSLQNILDLKPQAFGRQMGDAMDCVEYFISCEILRQIIESVQYLHELNPQIIHRDLKPENVLIAENVRNGRFVKLCDFGLAVEHQTAYQSHSKYKGTPKYMAPELHQSGELDKYKSSCLIFGPNNTINGTGSITNNTLYSIGGIGNWASLLVNLTFYGIQTFTDTLGTLVKAFCEGSFTLVINVYDGC
ncbi:unnamed protein product [Oppiella nova]|uniref:Protein kinase domain-containing protein n=1 Tax=Oppiella nova TaxID=334625 RepID=A0A7R9QHH1_9ACAR|nr:unnamed protein product [Oppiella nova]CAG2165845.1 unnamed protein product [Oppiella nova]